MSLRVREQFMCCFIAIILFLSGVRAEVPSVDLSFLCTQETVAEGSQSSVIRSGSKSSKLDQICIIGAIQRDTVAYLNGSRARNVIKRFLQNVALISAIIVLLSYLLCYGSVTEWSFPNKTKSHSIIVHYIQQKDGKK